MAIAVCAPRPMAALPIVDEEDAPKLRRLDCRQYLGCLTICCRSRWPGFSCNACSAYVSPTFSEKRLDLENIASLLLYRPRGK